MVIILHFYCPRLMMKKIAPQLGHKKTWTNAISRCFSVQTTCLHKLKRYRKSRISSSAPVDRLNLIKKSCCADNLFSPRLRLEHQAAVTHPYSTLSQYLYVFLNFFCMYCTLSTQYQQITNDVQ